MTQKCMDMAAGFAHNRSMILTSDELFLALVSLVRATRPAMLRQDDDGFTVDFEAIAGSKTPAPGDGLLLKIGALMEVPADDAEKGPGSGSRSLELDAAEARQLADALAKLERQQAWPEDVMNMSRALRSRLADDRGSGGDR